MASVRFNPTKDDLLLPDLPTKFKVILSFVLRNGNGIASKSGPKSILVGTSEVVRAGVTCTRKKDPQGSLPGILGLLD